MSELAKQILLDVADALDAVPEAWMQGAFFGDLQDDLSGGHDYYNVQEVATCGCAIGLLRVAAAERIGDLDALNVTEDTDVIEAAAVKINRVFWIEDPEWLPVDRIFDWNDGLPPGREGAREVARTMREAAAR